MATTHEPVTKGKILVSRIWPSRPEVEWARELGVALRRRGFDVNEEWSIHDNPSVDEVEAAMQASDLIVVLLDKRGINEPTLFFEYGAALGLRKEIVAVVPPGVDHEQLPPILRRGGVVVRKTPNETAAALIELIGDGAV